LIALCTTCKGRTQHLAQTLARNLANNPGPGVKFIVLDYNSQDDLLHVLKSRHEKEIASGRLVVYSYWKDCLFHMAHAKNMAHRLGILEGADILVNVDADNFTGPGFANYVAEQFNTSDCIFLWARMIKSGPERLPRGINGRIAVRAKDFLKAGGYDEQFQAWSPDDKDFNLRLRRLGCEGREIDPIYLDAILHNDKMRYREWGQDACQESYFASVVDSDATVVNGGKIGLGTVYRNFGNEPIELSPVPTRIFGIGMHKTATTSLHLALKILGYESAHWRSAHWAKAIWEEMQAWGRSLTLEKDYAVTDLPIPLMYKELDKAYPGSKFILTIRDEAAWIQSVKNHWDANVNLFRKAWDHDPFTHRVHKLLYGQKGFDAEVFLNRYRQHNDAVRGYFAGRPGDCLVLNMDRTGDVTRWQYLCGFFGKPVPNVPYPQAFPTKQQRAIIPQRKESSMSLLKTLETIGADILKGVEVAAPIIVDFVPKAAPILEEILTVIADLEAKGITVTQPQMSGLVQAMATTSAIKQAAAPKTTTPTPIREAK